MDTFKSFVVCLFRAVHVFAWENKRELRERKYELPRKPIGLHTVRVFLFRGRREGLEELQVIR